MNREYHEWISPNLHRKMELLVFGHSGARVIVFPTRGGRFFDYENFGMLDALKDSIEAGNIQLFCVDSVDFESFYCFWVHPRGRIERHIRYEAYIMEEVLPFSLKKNKNSFVITHGCSLGAYHAVNFALRHPHIFSKTVGFSGRYDLTEQTDGYANLLEGYYDEDVYFHMPSHYLPNLKDESVLSSLRNMEITLVVGERDVFLDNNIKLSEALVQKGINHSLHIWENTAHSAKYWRRMAGSFI